MRRLITTTTLLLLILAAYVYPTYSQQDDLKNNTGDKCESCNSDLKYLHAAVIRTPESPAPAPQEDEEEGILSSKNIRIINLGPIVNSPVFDYAPTVSADGRTLYFVSNRPGSKETPDGEYSHDFWYTTKENRLDTNFAPPKNLDTSTVYGNSGVNTSLNEGVASIAADNQSLYFTGCNRPDGLGNCDIYYAEIEGNVWGKPINLGKNVNSKYWDSQPSILYNKGRIYFTSNRPGPNGEDNMDIWYCDWDWDMEEWKPAKNLEAINTGGIDCSPFIGTDGVTLFFASDGHKPNYGKLDFYVTTLDQETNTWSKPQNLGKPINTEEDDQFITLPASGDIIYFSSKREDIPGYQGSLDLYMAFVPSFYKTVNIKVLVLDECSRENIPADIEVKNRLTGREEKGKVTLENKSMDVIVANEDYGPAKDSMPFVDLIITAHNPKYGSTESIHRVMRPTKTTDPNQAGSVEYEDTVVLTLGNRPVLTPVIAEADYINRMKSIDTNLAKFNGLVMEEVLTWNLYPLLNYVFFDEGKSEFPKRYIMFGAPEQTKAFADTTIAGGTLDKYYHLLNIYGYRLREHPESKIEIVGCIDTKSDLEKSEPNLSKDRAMNVYNYLKDIWGIDENRMKVVVRRDPKLPSNKNDSLGRQENRRVEILCDDWEIVKPVFDKDPTTFPQPEQMTYKLENGIEDKLITKRRVEIKHGDKMWKVLYDIGTIDKQTIWDWLNEDEEYPKDSLPFTAKLIVTTQTGGECESKAVEIPVMQVSTEIKKVEVGGDSTLENYSLILFPFNSSNAGPLNDKIMRDYVYGRCKPTSSITVIGHTDVVGLADHNLKLSQRRAETVEQGIEKKTDGKYGSLTTYGVGEEDPLYDNSLPEGRFYNRTVFVKIRTPVSEYENDTP